MHQVKVLNLPHGNFRNKGIPIDNVSNYNSAEEQMMGNGIAVGIDLAYLPSYAHSTTDTESLAKSITWASGGGVNSAALLVMPVITYKYDVIVPAHNATEEEKAAGDILN